MNEESLEQKLLVLKKNYIQNLPARIDEMKRLWHGIETTQNADDLKELIIMMHKLAGSAGMYDAHEISDQARIIENALNEIKDNDYNPNNNTRINAFYDELQRLVQSLIQ